MCEGMVLLCTWRGSSWWLLAPGTKRCIAYSLSDGVACSVVGRGYGGGDMQFNWHYGGVCVTPTGRGTGTVPVADYGNNRVPEVNLIVLDRFAHVFGQGERNSWTAAGCTWL